MLNRRKYSPDEKIQIIKEYLSGKSSLREIGQRLGYTSSNGYPGCFDRWLNLYRHHGEEAFYRTKGNSTYTKEFKMTVVEEYIDGKASACELTAKYQLSNASVLIKWVKLYNANRELKDYDPKREVYMAEARRKTTIDERKEIIEYCLSHKRDYKGTSSLYDVSYSQVYSWIKKYDASGEEGLTDKRGRHKTDDEVDEIERLRRENKRLKRQLEENDMLVQLLKKVKEFEGM
jgi:transposase-like protein